MSKTYPIVEVQQSQVLDPEDMGSKSKIWCRIEGREGKWLFKYPRENTGEHWAEKIAAAVAEHLGIPHGAVELAVFNHSRGSVTESFIDEGQGLFHGNQVLAGAVLGYDPMWEEGSQTTR